MKTVAEIANKVEAIELRSGDHSTVISSITYDSREVKEGTLFVALRGARFDGHRFVEAAIEQGAAAVLVAADYTYSGDREVPFLVAHEPRKILGELGRFYFDEPSTEMVMIGITGTNGKTSSAYLLEAIFLAAGRSTGVIGTVEYRWRDKRVSAPNTTPDGLVLERVLRAMADDGVEVVILEVSSHGLELGRVSDLHFDAAIFTNLSQDHLDFHSSMEAYRDAKRRLFFEILPNSTTRSGTRPLAVLNLDDDEGRALLELLETDDFDETLTLATHSIDGEHHNKASYHLEGKQLEIGLGGISMVIEESGGHRFSVESFLPGRFNAENILGVAAAARMLGVSSAAVSAGIGQCGGVPGRMQRVGAAERGPAVFVDYAHTPDALQRGLEMLRPLTSGTVWVVFGCGGDRDRSKRALMGVVAAKGADRVIITSDNPRWESPDSIIDAIVDGVDAAVEKGAVVEWERFVDREEAISQSIGRAAADDVILIAGKGHETYQEINNDRRDFDDRAVAQQALSQRGVQ